MNHLPRLTLLISALILGLTACADTVYQKSFNINPSDWSATGRNAFFVLEPGYQLILKGNEDGDATILTITVLNETKLIDGVETRIVEEREAVKGDLKEISRNYYAMDKTTGNIYYFGEDVDMYKAGKVAGHGGSWISGVKKAKFGLFMPGKPEVGLKYYQEVAPGTAMDRAEVVSVKETFETLAGTFTNCLKTLESSGLEAGKGENKYYAVGVGLIFDAGLKLAAHGRK
jgi:hypothetical protein